MKDATGKDLELKDKGRKGTPDKGVKESGFLFD